MERDRTGWKGTGQDRTDYGEGLNDMQRDGMWWRGTGRHAEGGDRVERDGTRWRGTGRCGDPVPSLSMPSHPFLSCHVPLCHVPSATRQRQHIYSEAIFSGNIDRFHNFPKSLEMYIYHSRYACTACHPAGIQTIYKPYFVFLV